jgi:hypothetical protein
MRSTTLYVNAGMRRDADGNYRGNRSHRDARRAVRRSLARELRADLAGI